MDSLQRLLHAMALVPTVVSSIESLFGRHAGTQKKEAAMSFVLTALELKEAVTNGEILDETAFRKGVEQMIEGAVECLEAANWGRRSADLGRMR